MSKRFFSSYFTAKCYVLLSISEIGIDLPKDFWNLKSFSGTNLFLDMTDGKALKVHSFFLIFSPLYTTWTAESADSEVAESRIGHNYTFLWPITHTLCTLNQGLALID